MNDIYFFKIYCSIYEMERHAQVPHKFQYPLFETFHWYAAKTFYDELKSKFNFLNFVYFFFFFC